MTINSDLWGQVMKQLLKEIAEVSAGQGAPQGDSNYCEDGIPFVKAGNLLEHPYMVYRKCLKQLQRSTG